MSKKKSQSLYLLSQKSDQTLKAHVQNHPRFVRKTKKLWQEYGLMYLSFLKGEERGEEYRRSLSDKRFEEFEGATVFLRRFLGIEADVLMEYHEKIADSRHSVKTNFLVNVVYTSPHKRAVAKQNRRVEILQWLKTNVSREKKQELEALFKRAIDFLQSVQADPATGATGGDTDFAPDDDDLLILRALLKEGKSMVQVELETATLITRKTVSNKNKILLQNSLIYHSKGPHGGVAISRKGKELLDKIKKSRKVR